MPQITFKDLTLSIGVFGGDVTVQIRSLKLKMPVQDLAARLYPEFDAEEKAEAAGLAKT